MTAGIFAATIALIVQAASPQVVDGIIVRPQWVQTPTAAQLALGPRTELPLNASVDMLCWLGSQGRFVSCVILNESPAGRGFGTAAIRASRYYRHSSTLEDGRSTEGMQVRVTVRWVEGA